MADASFTQATFIGGEISPLAQGRIDLPTYRMSMNVCLNGLPTETGSWVRRPGTYQVGHTRGGLPAREIKFDFEQDAPYRMEFTDGFLRWRAGNRLSITNDAQTIVSISTGNPAKVKTTTAHGWVSGNQVIFGGLGVNNPLLQNRQFGATVTSTTEFTLTDAITGATIDGATLGTFVSGTVSRIQEIATSYGSGSWSTLRAVQAEQSALLLHSTISPSVLSVTQKPVVGTDAQFSLSAVDFIDGPYLDPVKGGATVTPSALSGDITLTVEFTQWSATKAYRKGDYVQNAGVNYVAATDPPVGTGPTNNANWTPVSPGVAVAPSGFTGADIGRPVRLFSEPPEWSIHTTYGLKEAVTYNGAYYTNRVGGNTGAQPDLYLQYWQPNPSGAIWSWGKIKSVANLISNVGASAFGSLTQRTSAAFDGITDQISQLAANDGGNQFTFGSGNPGRLFPYLGRDFGGSPQRVSSVTWFPSSNDGMSTVTAINCNLSVYYTFNLRASNSAPASSSDGPIIGQVIYGVNTPHAVNIVSTDQTTAYRYVWVEIQSTIIWESGETPTLVTVGYNCAELQFFAPSGNSGASIVVKLLGDPLLYTTPIRTWRLGAYSDATGWPTCGTYHEGRLWLSGAIGNRIDGCVAGGIDGVRVNFAPTAPDGTVADSNAINYTFAAPDVNPVFWMTPDQQGIVCGTQAGEWLVQASAINSPLTPRNIQAHRVTKIGCANMEPQRTDHTLVFAQSYKRKIMEYFADVYSGKFAAPNLNERSNHLTLDRVQEIAYQQELVSTVWARTTTGALIGSTYSRSTLASSQGPSANGWHRHQIANNARLVEGICVGASADGTLDTLSLVTNDPLTNIRWVENMSNMPDESTTIYNAMFCDGAITPTFSQNVTVSGRPCLQLGGLWPHEGKSVDVFAGGLDLGSYSVSGGIVNVPYGAVAEFTSAYVAGYANMPIVVGHTYTSQGQIVRPAGQVESGARNGPGLGKKRRAQHYAALLHQTKGISFGTVFGKLNPALFKTSPDGGNALGTFDTKTGLHWAPLTDDNGFDSMLAWEITRPYPAMVVAVTCFLDTKDQ